jgi:hypothetical protein
MRGDLREHGAHESQERFGVGEEGCDARPAFDLPLRSWVDPLDRVAGPEPASMLGRQREDGEGFGDIGVDPIREVRRGLLVLREGDLGPPLRLARIRRVDGVRSTIPTTVLRPLPLRLASLPPVRQPLFELLPVVADREEVHQELREVHLRVDAVPPA